MLSHHERRRLGQLETWLHIEDPKFAEGLRCGDPHPPREYRRRPILILLSIGVVAMVVAFLTGVSLVATPAAPSFATAAVLRLCRRPDRPRR